MRLQEKGLNLFGLLHRFSCYFQPVKTRRATVLNMEPVYARNTNPGPQLIVKAFVIFAAHVENVCPVITILPKGNASER